MNIYVPPSEGAINIAAVKRAIDSKIFEVEQARKKLDDLNAELRGLHQALSLLNPKGE